MAGDTSTLPAEGRENPGREHGEADDETDTCAPKHDRQNIKDVSHQTTQAHCRYQCAKTLNE